MTPLSDDERRLFAGLLESPSTEVTSKDEPPPSFDSELFDNERKREERRLTKYRAKLEGVSEKLATKRQTHKLKNAHTVLREKIRLTEAVIRALTSGPSLNVDRHAELTNQILNDLVLRTYAHDEAAADDARRALDRFLKLIRRFIAMGGVIEGREVWSMILTAFQAGQTRERAFVRVHPVSVSHKELSAGGKKTSKKRKQKATDKKLKMQKAIDQYMKDGAEDGLSYTAATKEVAADCDVSVSNVGTLTQNKWPRRGGRKSTK